MTDRLSIYNDCLVNVLGIRKLGSSGLSENTPARHKLDSSWDGNLVEDIFQDTDWNFAMKTVMSDYDTGIEPEFGYQYGHPEPTNIWRLSGVYSDAYLENVMREYKYEGTVIYCDYQTLYLRYIPSTVVDDIGAWPGYFARHVAGQLGLHSSAAFKNSADEERVVQRAAFREGRAMSADAQRAPSKRIPAGNWINSRIGSRRKYDTAS